MTVISLVIARGESSDQIQSQYHNPPEAIQNPKSKMGMRLLHSTIIAIALEKLLVNRRSH